MSKKRYIVKEEPMEETSVNVPNVTDTAAALKLYYEKRELSTKDVMELFGVGRTKATRLKKMAKEEQQRSNAQAWDSTAVNTDCAFRAWGLSIRELEDKLGCIRRLRLNEKR